MSPKVGPFQSKQWSCSELEKGNKGMLKVKSCSELQEGNAALMAAKKEVESNPADARRALEQQMKA